jgi:CBS domain containing-hemolysin-like protein
MPLSPAAVPDEVFDACGFRMPDGPFETLAGFALDALGTIPSVGDSFIHDHWTIRIVQMEDRRIASLRLVAPSEVVTP